MVRTRNNFTRILFLSILSLVIVFNSVLAQPDHLISNSADWRDVYSTVIYANLLGVSSHFLTSTPHGPILLYEIPKTKQNIQIITSADKPFVVGYESFIRGRGYENPEELIFDEANLELAERLPSINKYIVIDDSYGYNAIAVAPFAVKAKYYVLLADDRNIGDVDDFLSTKNVDDMIIYGHVDREVRSALVKYNPEIINSETGSRFENNMMIVDKFSEIGSIKQVILTNGEFIEASMMSGKEPVLFIGRNNVPAEIEEYIKNRDIEIGVLIGNELIGTATAIRRQVGISVFVKFARGSRVPGGTINPVEDLDRFPMPSYQLSMSIQSIDYNKATGSLEVTYNNNVDLATYFKSTITIKNAAGETLAVVGDENTVFIDGGETKTIVYEVDLSEAENTENLTGEIYTIYGESKTSLENALSGDFKINIITVLDDAEIEITDLVYDKSRGRFLVTIENIGKVDVYVDVELVDLWFDGEYITVSADDIEKIGVGKKKTIPIKIKLEEEDLEDKRNEEITVRGVYGERKHALVKSKTRTFKLRLKKAVTWWYIPIIIVVVIIILLLLLLLLKRRKKKCPRCRTKNDKNAAHCKKCGHSLR
ncbi:zinc ribbon domain-containing protein [Candidatus Woesearchaeota archaeon]|nr:zinc ribbon domain-containing protein [Candidatus Woesearchaeota archaeon]